MLLLLLTLIDVNEDEDGFWMYDPIPILELDGGKLLAVGSEELLLNLRTLIGEFCNDARLFGKGGPGS